ncbi:hypothetical protein [Allocoleopsis sp.]|uniref:hypothetical protein n=1 Tax=Allocoleopsis sp. TaxID=3088169 RepID=UPI002FD19F55
MSSHFKILLVVLAGMAMTLSACSPSDVTPKASVNQSETVATPEASATSQEPRTSPSSSPSPFPQKTTSSVSPSPIRQPTHNLSPESSKSKSSVQSSAKVQSDRENYKAMELTKIAKDKAVIGNDPKAIAVAAFGDVDSEGGSRDIQVEYPQPDRAVVIVTQTGVADDSVRAIRYRAELVPTTKSSQTGKQWKMVWAGSQFTCQPGRGHQDWSMKLCS